MRYAITYENKQVFQHFGKCPSFLIVDMQDGKILNQEILSSNGAGHGALCARLVEAQVDTLVCGGIGQGARDTLQAANIQLISGAKGHTDIILNKLSKQTLFDDPSGRCDHHHEGEEHDCGSHDCGGHE